MKTNTISTLKLLEYSKKFNIKKFIYSSSSCVYGNILNDASEGSKIKLDTPYAISKFTSENYCNFYRDYHKLNIIILRLFNTFGPLERIKKDSNVICRFFHNAIKNEDLNITGINSSRSFLFIDDLIDGFEIIINDKCFDNQTINIGSKEHTKIKKLAEKIINLTNSKSKIIISEPRKWDTVINRSAKIDKIYKLSNWSQKHSLDQGLKLYYEWLKKNDPKTINY